MKRQSKTVFELLAKATDDLVQMRQREGAQIKVFIQERAQHYFKVTRGSFRTNSRSC